ncbi:PREDICTED: uncharacterized protein LOC105451132 [Wasmannia auropunctata]|uniref:uncharacterized protein LOC105451132 n=1 Tax=Wasmannia auropunctata TaxID=64793 RepID=UPI0005ED4D6F|nr:PREDICTED: uncharacterized protein LOC105451132 [Wasmannia auropunctata]XP_011689703.1 PREDICTED: uncharacterized protein LOC105451132 [Wasmannia auropunctata]
MENANQDCKCHDLYQIIHKLIKDLDPIVLNRQTIINNLEPILEFFSTFSNEVVQMDPHKGELIKQQSLDIVNDLNVLIKNTKLEKDIPKFKKIMNKKFISDGSCGATNCVLAFYKNLEELKD